MRRLGFVVGMAGLAMVSATAAFAQATPESDDSRYTFNRTGDGYLRLDSQTGHVSLCTRRAAGWACQAVPDERAALEAEIARLQTENAALKKEFLARKLPLPDGTKADAKPKGDGPLLRLPNDADVDKVVSFLERLWRRLVEMMVNIQNDVLKKT